MPTYALLGATGATGSSILRSLLSNPPKDLTLKILIRNKPKLLRAFPGLESDSNPPFPVQIIQGTSTDPRALESCLSGVDAIFMCVAVNVGKPNESLSLDTAKAILSALSLLRDSSPRTYRPPTILALRVGHLNPKFELETPWFVRQMTWFCLYWVYSDLVATSEYYMREREREGGRLFGVTFIDPPAIHDPEGREPATGYELVTERRAVSANLSYADLGEAFVEVAGRRGEFEGEGVVVSATGEVKTTWEVNRGMLLESLKNRVFGWVGM